MKDVLEIVVQGGALGLLALVLLAGLYVVLAVVPSIKTFLERLTSFLAGVEARLAVLETKLDGVVKSESDAAAALTNLGLDIQEEGAATRDLVREFERRSLHRQEAPEPPTPLSRPSTSPGRRLAG